ncbi:MAG: creatininase family protein [Anaerolineales bacterium]|nr:creatininase family protein [Anaerolineales bacterium]
MRFSDLNWFDVENYLQQDDRLMLVIGACEQHGYLSLLTDTKIPQALGEAAAQQSGVLLAPALNFGASPYFLAYPGTLSLRISTLLDLVEDLVRSAHGQGFRRFLFLNGHGGNEPVKARLYELANQVEGLQIRWYSWWLSHSVEAVALAHDLKRYHAGWLEAFSFTRVAELPEGEKQPPEVPGLMGAAQAREVYGDGVFGGAYQVDDAIMQAIFEAARADVLHLLNFD